MTANSKKSTKKTDQTGTTAPAGSMANEMPTVIAAMLFSARRWHRSQSNPTPVADARGGVTIHDTQSAASSTAKFTSAEDAIESAIKFG